MFKGLYFKGDNKKANYHILVSADYENGYSTNFLCKQFFVEISRAFFVA